MAAFIHTAPCAPGRWRSARSWRPIDADLVLVSRVLTNIVENAIQHGPKNTPISIRAAQTAPG